MSKPLIILFRGSDGRGHDGDDVNDLSRFRSRGFHFPDNKYRDIVIHNSTGPGQNRNNVERTEFENTKLEIIFGTQNHLGKHRYDGRRDVTVDRLDRICNGDSEDATDQYWRVARELRSRYSVHFGRYLTDVVIPPRHIGVDQVIAEITSLCELPTTINNYGFRIVAKHDDHIHIAHACAYSNRSCRCSWLVNSTSWRRWRRSRLRRGTILSSITTGDWNRILRYYTTDGRVAVYALGGEADGGNGLRSQNLQVLYLCLQTVFILLHFLRIFRKQDIRNLPKDQWYTVADVKMLGTVNERSEPARLLHALKCHQLAELKRSRGLKSVRQYRWAARRQ